MSKFGKGQLENEILEDGEALKVKKEIEGWSPTLKLPLRWISFADHRGITLGEDTASSKSASVCQAIIR